MLETPIFAKVAKKPSAECNKENMSPDLIQLKTEIDDMDKKQDHKVKKPMKKLRCESKKNDDPPIKKRKLTYQEQQDHSYARRV